MATTSAQPTHGEAAKIALRTQQVVAFESGVPDTADPLAGSYYVEALTSDMEKASWQLIEKIDAMGGSVAAIEEGFIQDEIAASAYEYQKQIETQEKIIVGVNKFISEETYSTPSFKIDEGIQKLQIDKLNSLKERRDNKKALECLSQLEMIAQGPGNLMPAVLEAVENYCSLGEISDTLRKVFGEYK
jgi:methylmalonyl-CoA mutase N-terminal domain/subunit